MPRQPHSGTKNRLTDGDVTLPRKASSLIEGRDKQLYSVKYPKTLPEGLQFTLFNVGRLQICLPHLIL